MILVVAEQREGTLNRASWEAIAAAQQLGDSVKVVVAGSGVADAAKELAKAFGKRGIALQLGKLFPELRRQAFDPPQVRGIWYPMLAL